MTRSQFIFPVLVVTALAGLALWFCADRSRDRHATAEPTALPGDGTERLRADAGEVRLLRPFVRVELEANEQRTYELEILNGSAERLEIISARSDCRCVRNEKLPAAVPPGQIGRIELLVFGVLPGSKTVEIATSAGTLRATFQVVVAGQGTGAELAARATERLGRTPGGRMLVIVHDLKGKVRGCGCSGSALGGLGRLRELKKLLPADRTTWLATGDWSGVLEKEKLSPLIRRAGITICGDEEPVGLGSDEDPLSVVCTTQPEKHLQKDRLTVMADRSGKAPRNARVIRPALDEGMGVQCVVVNRRGLPVESLAVPLDASLEPQEADAGLAKALAALHPPLGAKRIELNMSQNCRSCHEAAYEKWQATRHAKALESLMAADRGTSCASCHTTRVDTRSRAGHVHCQSCHADSEAHVKDSTRKTTPVGCVSCHDSTHHPTFDYDASWKKIKHR